MAVIIQVNVAASAAIRHLGMFTAALGRTNAAMKRMADTSRGANQYVKQAANLTAVANSANTAANAALRHAASMRQQSAAARTLHGDLQRVHRIQSQLSITAVRTGARGQTITHRETAARSVIDARAAGAIEREQARTAAAVARSNAIIQQSFRRTGTEKDKLHSNFQRFGSGATQVMAGLRQAFQKTFAGTGGVLNLGARLFAPLGVAMRGFDDLARAFKGLTGLLTINPFRAASAGFTILGDAVSGLTKIFAGVTSQAFRFLAAPARILSAITRIVPGIGQAISLASGIVGGFVSFVGDSLGEVAQLFGRAFRGIAGIAAVALKPLASAFDFLVSPITRVFQLIKVAWDYSLVGMGAATVLFTKSAASAFLAFERNVSEALSQIPRVGQEAFGQMQDVAMHLSRELGKGPTQIVDAVRLATSVGFSAVNDYTEIARQATRFATAGFADIETSVKALTNLLNSYGLGADSAREVNDLLFRGFQVGGGSAQFFANGLGVVASTVKAAGGSMEDLIATTALLSRAAAGNSRSFIEVSQAFSRLSSPTTQAARAMQQMGITLARNATGGIDFFETLGNIQQQIKALSGGDQIRAFQLLKNIFPEERAARAFAKLMSANADSIREVRDAMRGARGSIDDALGQVNQRAFRQIEIMKAAFERLKITVGGALAPALTAAANSLGQFFDRMQREFEGGRFRALGQSFKNIFSAMDIRLDTGGITEGIIKFFADTLPKTIDQYVVPAVTRFRDLIGSISVPGIVDWLDSVRERAIGAFVGAGKAALAFARPVLSVINSVGQSLLGLGEILTGVGKIGQSAFNVISAGVRGLGSLVVDLVAKFYDMTAAMHRVAAASPFSDAPTRLNQAQLAIGSENKANEWRTAARALQERAGADIGQAATQSAAGQASIAQGAKRLGDVFSGRTQAPAWLDQFSAKLDSISKDFGKPFIDKLRGLAAPGVSSIPNAGPAPIPPKPFSPTSGGGVVVPFFSLDPRGARRTAHETEMQRRRQAFEAAYPGVARRTRPTMPQRPEIPAGAVPQPPELPGAPASMKGGRALMDLLGPSVRQPALPRPPGLGPRPIFQPHLRDLPTEATPAPAMQGGGKLLDLPARGSGRESTMLRSAAQENVELTSSVAGSVSGLMTEVAELLAASNANLAQLQEAVQKLKYRNQALDAMTS